MKRKNNLKLPNGFGSILFLGNKRRHPYAALKTTGWDDNGRQIRKYVGYAKTYNEAYQILLNYSSNPFDINSKNIIVTNIKLNNISSNLISKDDDILTISLINNDENSDIYQP